jgi:hypothetical protein
MLVVKFILGAELHVVLAMTPRALKLELGAL